MVPPLQLHTVPLDGIPAFQGVYTTQLGAVSKLLKVCWIPLSMSLRKC